MVLRDAGPRRSELLGMRLEDLDFEYDVVRVVGKGGRPGDGALLGGGDTAETTYQLETDGRIRRLVIDHWDNPNNRGVLAWHRFGGKITGYRTFEGLTIPSEGRLG
jgi:integrase